MSRVRGALEAAGDQLGLDWTDYFAFAERD